MLLIKKKVRFSKNDIHKGLLIQGHSFRPGPLLKLMKCTIVQEMTHKKLKLHLTINFKFRTI